MARKPLMPTGRASVARHTRDLETLPRLRWRLQSRIFGTMGASLTELADAAWRMKAFGL